MVGRPLPPREAMLAILVRHLDMVRLSAAGAVMIALVGCTGLIEGGGDGVALPQRDPRASWQRGAFPALETSCVACHDGSRPMIGFLAGSDDLAVRDTLMAYDPPVVNLEATASSRIVTKGEHDGPALTAGQAAALLEWLDAEREAQGGPGPIQVLATPKFTAQLCMRTPDNPMGPCPINHVALSTVPGAGAGVPGAEITFVAEGLSSGLYVHDLELHSGTAGLYVEHALFVSRPASGAPLPDQIDRYFAMKLNVMPNVVAQIDGGTAQFGGFAPTDKVEIHFKVLSAFQPDTGGGGTTRSGCKALATFKTNAVPQLKASCAGCHAGANVGAKSAMDITGHDAPDDATVLAACNQVWSRLNLTVPDQSGFYLAPNPADATNHPIKLPAATFATFKAAMDVWVNAEKTAP